MIPSLLFRRKVEVAVIGLLVALGLLLSFNSMGQTRDKVYSVFLLNFARHIQWPDGDGETFVIGVLDYSPLVSELKNVARTKTLGTRKITVVEYQTVSQIRTCDMLFIPESRAASLPTIIGKFPYSPMLIVSEKPGLSELGSNINLLTVNGKVKFQINNKAMNGRGLKVSDELLVLAMPTE